MPTGTGKEEVIDPIAAGSGRGIQYSVSLALPRVLETNSRSLKNPECSGKSFWNNREYREVKLLLILKSGSLVSMFVSHRIRSIMVLAEKCA